MALSTTFMPCATEATEFCEIMQNKNHFVVQNHSRSQILVPIESSYTTSNTNLRPILHRLRDIAFEMSKSLFGYPSCV